MKKVINHIKEHFDKYLIGFAIGFTLFGCVIFFLYFVDALRDSSIIGGETIRFEETAQFGDFIGGVVGSLWSLAGVLLFYQALRLQRKEFKNQQKEMRLTTQALNHLNSSRNCNTG